MGSSSSLPRSVASVLPCDWPVLSTIHGYKPKGFFWFFVFYLVALGLRCGRRAP